MKINGTPYRTIWQNAEGVVQVIDQRWLPHELRVVPVCGYARAMITRDPVWRTRLAAGA